MGAPQIIMIVLFAMSFTIALLKHGEYRTDKHSVWATLLGGVIEFGLLKWGGFFG